VPGPKANVTTTTIDAGFLVSIEVFSELRVPFTHIVLWRRRQPAAAPPAAQAADAVQGR
jgi:hypothetical protein